MFKHSPLGIMHLYFLYWSETRRGPLGCPALPLPERTPSYRDEGKVVAITGASSGISLEGLLRDPRKAVARAVTFAIEQTPNVEVNEIVIRPTAQG
jgi:hypothetical protein